MIERYKTRTTKGTELRLRAVLTESGALRMCNSSYSAYRPVRAVRLPPLLWTSPLCPSSYDEEG